MIYLLWTLAIIGAWNGVSLIARLYCGESLTHHSTTVVFGLWAGYLLIGDM